MAKRREEKRREEKRRGATTIYCELQLRERQSRNARNNQEIS